MLKCLFIGYRIRKNATQLALPRYTHFKYSYWLLKFLLKQEIEMNRFLIGNIASDTTDYQSQSSKALVLGSLYNFFKQQKGRQLLWLSWRIPEVRGSNPVTGDFQRAFVYCFELTKNKEREAFNVSFLKIQKGRWYNHHIQRPQNQSRENSLLSRRLRHIIRSDPILSHQQYVHLVNSFVFKSYFLDPILSAVA